jgi:hypothetical protein
MILMVKIFFHCHRHSLQIGLRICPLGVFIVQFEYYTRLEKLAKDK